MKRFGHFGSTSQNHFGTSGAPWDAIFAPRNHPGGPWEKQDGHEVANNRIFVDLGVISGLVSVSFWVQNALEFFFFRLVSKTYSYRFLPRIFELGLPNRCFRMEDIAKVDFSWKSFLVNFGMHFCLFLEALVPL